MMKLQNGITACLLAVLLAGCAANWVRVEQSDRRYAGEHYTVTLPAGWIASISRRASLTNTG